MAKNNKTFKKLHKEYEQICNEIVRKFSIKQDLEFSFWVGDDVGGIACFIDEYFFNMHDIIIDLKTNQEKGFILKWQEEMVSHNLNNEQDTVQINYNSYCIGLRLEHISNNKI